MIAKRVIIGLVVLILLGGVITALVHVAGWMNSSSSVPGTTTNQFVYTSQDSYLAVEVLDDHVIHFEAAGKQVAAQNNQILVTSPMVVKKNILGRAA